MVASIPFTRCLCYKPERFRFISPPPPYTSKVKIVLLRKSWLAYVKDLFIYLFIFAREKQIDLQKSLKVCSCELCKGYGLTKFLLNQLCNFTKREHWLIFSSLKKSIFLKSLLLLNFTSHHSNLKLWTVQLTL